MCYRVIQWGTGNVGKHALRAIIERPDLELVGLKVYSDAKVGLDAGSFVGLPDTGIVATASIDEILACEADCVAYTALGVTRGPIEETIDEICVLLSHGFNVVSSAIEQAIYPKALPADIQRRLETACEKGDSSFLAAGINPGFTMDLWAINMSRLSRRIDKISTLEVCDMVNYDSVENMHIMGFGRTPEQIGELVSARFEGVDELPLAPFYASALMVSDALRFPLDAIRFESDYGLAAEPIKTAVGVIEPGTVAVVKLRQVGESGGRDVLFSEWVWRTTDAVNPEWGVGEYWSMTVEGDPDMHCRLEARTRFDSRRIVSLVVATSVVNTVPVLCDATSGVKSALDLPPCGGGMVPSPIPVG